MRTFFSIIGLLFLTVATQSDVRADTITYDAVLNGASVATPTNSPGKGFAIVTINTLFQTMEVNVTFSGLESREYRISHTLLHCNARGRKRRCGDHRTHIHRIPLRCDCG